MKILSDRDFLPSQMMHIPQTEEVKMSPWRWRYWHPYPAGSNGHQTSERASVRTFWWQVASTNLKKRRSIENDSLVVSPFKNPEKRSQPNENRELGCNKQSTKKGKECKDEIRVGGKAVTDVSLKRRQCTVCGESFAEDWI
jgi:hypothetical protein